MRTLIFSLFLISLGAALPAQEQSWLEVARAHMASNEDTGGLVHFIDALEQFDEEEAYPLDGLMQEVCLEGWTGEQPAVSALLISQRGAITAATRAAEAGTMSCPPPGNPNGPNFKYLELRSLLALMSAEARYHQSRGNSDTAAICAVRAMQFSHLFGNEDAYLVQHSISMAGQRYGRIPLKDILSQGGLSPDTLELVYGELVRIDQSRVGWDTVFIAEGESFLDLVKASEGDLGEINNVLAGPRQIAEIERCLEDFDTFATEFRDLWRRIGENAAKPLWERENIDVNWVRRESKLPEMYPLYQIAYPTWQRVVILEDSNTANIRLFMAACAIRMEDQERLQSIVDPYSGEPLLREGNRIWSVGPDMEDQGGNLRYDPALGLLSPGDIVITLQP